MKFFLVALVVAAATLADARSLRQRSIADDIKNSMQAALEKALLTTTANNLETSVIQKINETIVTALDNFIDKLNLDMWITQFHLDGVIDLADIEAFAIEQAMTLITPILDSLKEQGIQLALQHMPDQTRIRQRSIADDIKNSMQAALEKALLTTTANNLETSALQKINETIISFLDNFMDKINLDYWITQLHLDGVVDLTDLEAFAVEQAMNLVTPILDELKEQGIDIIADHIQTKKAISRRNLADTLKESMQHALEQSLLTSAADHLEQEALDKVNEAITDALDNLFANIHLPAWLDSLNLGDLEQMAVQQAMQLITPILDSLKEQGIDLAEQHM